MALFVADITYDDGSVVRIHREALTESQIKQWFKAHRYEYERLEKVIISLLILRATDARSL